MTPGRQLFLIFGASRGLGRAIYNQASRFTANDFILVSRHPAKISRPNSKTIVLDLAQMVRAEILTQLFDWPLAAEYEAIFLINNASVVEPIKPVGQIESSRLVDAFWINFLNYSLIMNEFIKQTKDMPAVKKRILNISSGAAVTPHHGLAVYSSAKAALEMLTECIFLEQQTLKQVKILALRPGVMDTAMQKIIRETAAEDFPTGTIHRELGRQKKLLPPEQVAEKIYKILETEIYWQKPIIDIAEVK